jgi:REP element-mobilizing transposase RayT
LKGYDYAQVGAYFITIVTEHRTCLFGNIIDNKMYLNSAGQVVQSVWTQIPEHFSGIDVDTFVVMPNHVHGIILITNKVRDSVGAQHAAPSEPNVQAGSIGAIIRSFKSAVTKQYNKESVRRALRIWQRNYYEHIIRDENALIRIRDYIATNPTRWSSDPENSDALQPESNDVWRGAQHAAPLHGILKT